MAETGEFQPLIPGQSPKPNNRAGPAIVRAFSSGRAYLSVAVQDQLRAVAAERERGSPQVEAVQLYPDVKNGKVYVIPCTRDATGAYLLNWAKDTRESWVSFLELYDAFSIRVPTRMIYTIEGARHTHEQLGPCVILHLGAAQPRSRRYRDAAVDQAAAGSQSNPT